MITANPVVQKDFSERSLAEPHTSITANAGATAIFTKSVPINTKLVVKGVVVAAAGKIGATLSSSAQDATADTITVTAHGLSSGTPVLVGGTANPAGVTAGTIYFANAVDANTIKLYDTAAHAAAGGSTGLVDITGTGTAVTVTPTVVTAAYNVFAAVVNRNGTTVLTGSPSVTALEDVAAWDCSVVADNTADALVLKVTPDATLDTRARAFLEIYSLPADVRA